MGSSDRKTSITLGAKGSTLSSSSVFQIAHSLSLLSIDPSYKFSSFPQSPPPKSSQNPQFALPNYLNPQEIRAFFVTLLNKIITLPKSSIPNETAAFRLVGILNLPEFRYPNDDECLFLAPFTDYCNAAMVQGVCALLDHGIGAVCLVADAVAALSCEALRMEKMVDSGDGVLDKDEASVATDLKVFLNGSKLVGKDQLDFCSIDDIVEINGALRFVSRTLHTKTRVFLNSSRSRVGGLVFLCPLAETLVRLGESSGCRAKLIVGALGHNNDNLFVLRFMLMFNKRCPGREKLKEVFNSFQVAYNDNDYLKCVHEIYILLDLVNTVLAWETTAAFVSLSVEGGDEFFVEKKTVVELKEANFAGDGFDAKSNGKKQQKEKKKNKVVMGKGTTALMQFLKDKMHGLFATMDGEVEFWVQKFLSFLDPKEREFECLCDKIKDIVDSNESRRLPKIPKGTRDFAKEQMAVREKAFSIIIEVFKRHGAMGLDTPVFEMRETLMGKYGEDQKLIYDLADQGGELCSLRYDLTVPFARYVAMHGLTSFKRYQIAKVYRRDNPSMGRYREFYQCDFDIAGQFETMGPDFEVIYILAELLDMLNIGEYEVKLSHRKLLDGMLEICGVPPEKFRTICSSIDKLDKVSFEQIKKEMVEEKGLKVETADKIGTFVRQRGRPLDLLFELRKAGSELIENSASLQALNELEILFKALKKAKCIDKVILDLSLARGLNYYTGVVFEAVFKGATQIGSIGGGGRYDKLIGEFGTKQVPAVGVCLGIERVLTIMEQLQKDQNQVVRPTETEVLVSVLGDDLSLASELVAECWRAKLNAEMLLNKRVMKHIDRAKDSKIPWMVIVGEQELNEGIVRLKDVVANKEEEVPRSSFVEELQRRLSRS